MKVPENVAEQSILGPKLKELFKLSASQINRCAFCLDMHTKEALVIGESEQRLMYYLI
jgi:AhpD family alkylhydroperoxidase